MKVRFLPATALIAVSALALFTRPDFRDAAAPGVTHSSYAVQRDGAEPGDGERVPSPDLASTVANPESRSPAFPKETDWKRFAGADTIASEVRPVEAGVFEQVRLIRNGTAGKLVRVVEHRRVDPETGENRLLRREAMAGNRILMLVESDAAYAALRAFARDYGYSLSERLDYSSVVRLTFPDPGLDSVPDALAALESASPAGTTAEPDLLYFPADTPNDPGVALQWGLEQVQAFEAWQVETGSAEVYLAVLDSGIDPGHEDLSANIAHDLGRNFTGGAQDTNFGDATGHGTSVSGVIGAAGNNGIGIAGVAWRTRIIPIRIGNDEFSTSSIIAALDYVTDLRENQGVRIVATNNSYGAQVLDRSEALRQTIVNSSEAGILFVAAAGNNGDDMDAGDPFYPAAYDVDNIIAVAATAPGGSMWNRSSYGSDIVHLGAPGEDIYTTNRNDNYGFSSGTSLAAPFVTATIGLMASAGPDLSADALKTRLLDTVTPLPSLDGRTRTGGVLDVNRAVRSAARRIQLHWTTPSAAFLRLPGSDVGLRLQVRGERDGEPESLESEALSWETLDGPAEIDFRAAGDSNAVLARFPEEGEYRVRAVYLDGDEARPSREIAVAVGKTTGPPGEGLLAHWAFDEDAGDDLTDQSGNNRHGDLGTASRDDGLLGRALRFDGDRSRATVSAPRTERIAISAWVKADSPGQSEIPLPRILETGEHTLFWGRMDHQRPNRSNVKFVARRHSAQGEMGVWYTEAGTINDGEWFHVAVSYDGSSTANDPEIFIDGRKYPVETQLAPSGPRPSDAEATAWLGNSEDRDRAWHGLIDDVRVYDRPVDEDAIAGFAFPAPAALPEFETPVFAARPHTFSASARFPESAENEVRFSWEKLSGPGEVAFDEADGDNSASATFSEPGAYTLSVTADDGRAATTVEVVVDVAPAKPLVHLEAERSWTLRSPLYPVEVRFVADGVLNEDQTIPFEIGGDAAAGEDYRLDTNGTPEIVISEGASSAVLTLTPLPTDPVAESRRSVFIEISDPHLAGSPASLEVALLPQTYANWRDFFFQGQPAGDGENHHPEARYTDDGLTNLLKYALGLDPLRPARLDAEPVPTTLTVSAGDDDYPALAFVRPAGLGDVRYRVEVTDNLDEASWNADPTTEHEVVDLGDGRERVVIRDTRPLEGLRQRFLRLKVLLPDDDS